ncbi:hypothetical protein BX667DRAFT_506380 [Coemansia mojavensis]|nr:hypothetical protein BX667DRAFT_506380 [Coemansia mojavensis]
MAHLMALPEDLLYLVIKELFKPRSISNNFKANLKSLAVCSEWRRLSLPVVYRELFLYYKLKPNNVIAVFDDIDDDASIYTNIGLVHHVGATLVKHIDIRISQTRDVLDSFTKVVGLMRKNVYSAKSLSLSIESTGTFQNASTDTCIAGLEALTLDFNKLMPKLTSIRFAHSRDERVKALYGMIANGYAHQMVGFTSNCCIQVTNYMSRLETLVIRTNDRENTKLPQINSKALQRLTLLGSRWITDGKVKLDDLNELKICVDSTDSSTFQTQILQPDLVILNLRSLTLRALCNGRTLLDRISLPKYVDKIDISADEATYSQLATMTLPKTSKISLNFGFSTDGNSNVVGYMNQILSKMGKVKSSSMELDDIPISADDITYTSLTRLVISYSTHIGTVVALLNKLHCLESLNLPDTSLEYALEVISDIDDEQLHPLAPLNLSLTTILLYTSTGEYEQNLMITVMVYLLLRLPSLRHFCVYQIDEEKLFKTLRPYLAQYPHIKQTELILLNRDRARYSVGAYLTEPTSNIGGL